MDLFMCLNIQLLNPYSYHHNHICVKFAKDFEPVSKPHLDTLFDTKHRDNQR